MVYIKCVSIQNASVSFQKKEYGLKTALARWSLQFLYVLLTNVAPSAAATRAASLICSNMDGVGPTVESARAAAVRY